MKGLIIATLFATSLSAFAQVSVEQRQVRSVEVQPDSVLLISADVCPNGYPGLTTHVTKLNETSALVEISITDRSCSQKKMTAKFSAPLSTDLVDLGLDPAHAKLFVQVR